MNTLWGWGRASWAGCGPDVRRGGQTLIMGYSADKSPLIGHLAGPLRRLEPLVAQRQEKCGPNRPTPTGYSCNNAVEDQRAVGVAARPPSREGLGNGVRDRENPPHQGFRARGREPDDAASLVKFVPGEAEDLILAPAVSLFPGTRLRREA